MGNFNRVLVLAISIGLWSHSPGLAADANGNFAVDGIGARTCADFNAIREDPDAMRAFGAWTDGFLTAYNVFEDATFDITPWQTIELTLARMQRYCEDQPQVAYINGLASLIGAMAPKRMPEADRLISVRNGERSVFVYASILDRIRAALDAAGFAPPPASGDDPFDTAFVEALLTYQRSKGLPQTGLPDLPTLVALNP